MKGQGIALLENQEICDLESQVSVLLERQDIAHLEGPNITVVVGEDISRLEPVLEGQDIARLEPRHCSSCQGINIGFSATAEPSLCALTNFCAEPLTFSLHQCKKPGFVYTGAAAVGVVWV